jgi:RNA polymerase sigma-70 factor (ECF subfamily)
MPLNDEKRALHDLSRLDSQAISAIYDQYFPQIYRYVLYRVSDPQTAEDIASDVFVRLLEAVQGDRGPRTHLKGWLIATASHAVTDHHRRQYRRPVEALAESLSDLRGGLQAEFDRREQKRTVQKAYVELTAEQQDVLALRFGQGYSLEETASLLGKNANAIKALQFRALNALQRQLREVSDERSV